MADTRPDGMKEKEDANATALSARVSVIRHTSMQGAEFNDLSEFYHESKAQVLPLIGEEATTDVLEKPKKPRRPKQKKKKNNSNATEQALQMQPVDMIHPSSGSAGEKIEVLFIQEPSTSEVNPPDNIKLLAAEQGLTEAISNQDTMTQVLPVIAEEVSTNMLGKPIKSRKLTAKINKNKSNTTEQALQMQPANIIKASSSIHDEIQVNFIPEPCKSKMNLPKNIKPLDLVVEQGVPDAISDEDPIPQVLPVIAEEVSTNIMEMPKQPINPEHNKNISNTTEQALQMQPANMNKVLSSAIENTQVHFIDETSKSKIYPSKIIKKSTRLQKRGVPSYRYSMEILPVVIEETLEDILNEKPKKQRKPRQKKKKNNSSTVEQASKMLPVNIKGASSETQLFQIQEHSTNNIENKKLDEIQDAKAIDYAEDILNKKTKKQRKPRQKKKNSSTVEQALKMLPANINGASSETQMYQIQEPSMSNVENKKLVETQDAKAIDYAEDILYTKPKQQRKPRQKKNKHISSTVELALQMLPANTSGPLSEINVYQIQEPSTSNVENKSNEMKQKRETRLETKKVLVAVKSKQHGLTNSKVINTIKKTMSEKKVLPIENVPKEAEKLHNSKDAMHETDEKAEGSAQTPVQINYFPAKAVGNDDEKPKSSKYVLKESDQKVEGNAEPQVQRHLLFFREYYDHSGRLSLGNINEQTLYIDGLYSQVKLACMDHFVKDKIEEAIHSIMNDITIDFKDFRVPIQKLETLFNRMHNIIFMRLYRIGLTEMALIETCNTLAIYRSHFRRADDLRFMFSLMTDEEQKLFSK